MARLLLKEKIVIAAVFLIAGAFFLYFSYTADRVKRVESPYESTGNFAMGTYVNQKIYCTSDTPDLVTLKAYNAISSLENKISWRLDDSDIRALNENETGTATVSPKTFSLLETSLDIARRSNGAYDPTILPVIRLWGFDGDFQSIPHDQELKDTCRLVDYTAVKLDSENSRVSFDRSDMTIDLGAIGKGAGCDEAINVYRECGVSSGLVAVGGSIGLLGAKPDGSAWEIGVRDPRGESSDSVLGTLSLQNCFVSTSGDYEKFFVEASNYYHHIINPKTGSPSNSGIISATIVCANGALSDAAATACVVLGRTDALKFISELNVQAILVDDEKKVYVTTGLYSLFHLTAKGYTIIEV